MRAIPSNPAADVEPPRRKREVEKEVRPLSLDQLRLFRPAVEDDRYECYFHTALDSGMRPSELLGFQRPQVRWSACELQVIQSLRRPRGGGWVLEPCKTAHSRRVVTVDQELMARLRRHRTRQLEERLASASGSVTRPST